MRGADVISVLCFGALCAMAGVAGVLYVNSLRQADEQLSRRIIDVSQDMRARTDELHRMFTAAKAGAEV